MKKNVRLNYYYYQSYHEEGVEEDEAEDAVVDNNEGDAGGVVSSCGLGIDISLSVFNIFSRT